MKKFLLIILILLCVCGCSKGREEEVTVSKFKKEYEALNDSNLELDLENTEVIKYSSVEDVNALSEGIVYVGKKDDDLSRCAIDTLLKVSASTGVKTIYYIDNTEGLKYDASIPTVLFIKDGSLVDSHEGTIDDKTELSDDEVIELYNIYSTGIHKVLGDACDEKC